MIKRFSALLLVLTLAFCLVSACADAYPVQRGAVNDDAAVLSDETAKDIASLNDRSSAHYTVITRHFLGGQDAQAYCDGLFKAWNLGKDDLLLLLVIGEERYAVSLGADIAEKALSKEQLNSLLSAKLRQSFVQERNYDGAVGSFFLAAAGQISRAKGENLNTAGLFGSSQTLQNDSSGNTSSNAWMSSWSQTLNGFFSDDDLNSIYTNGANVQYYEEDSGFSTGRLIFILIVVFLIIRSRRKRGKTGLGILGLGAAAMGAKEAAREFRRPPRR